MNLIAYATEFAFDKFGRTHGVARVVEADVQAFFHFPDKCRAHFVGAAANGNHVIPLVVEVFIHLVGCVVADINTDFSHRFYRSGIQFPRCFRSGGTNRDTRIERLQETVRHLAAATVSGAKN